MKVFNPSPRRPAIAFVDLPQDPKHQDYWVRGPIEKAYRGQLMQGISANRFNYGAHISRAEVMVSLGRAIAVSPEAVPNATQTDAILSAYADANALPPWAKRDNAQQSIAIAAQHNLVVNPPGIEQNRLHPNRLATRAEVVAMLYQVLVYLQQVEPIASNPTHRTDLTFEF